MQFSNEEVVAVLCTLLCTSARWIAIIIKWLWKFCKFGFSYSLMEQSEKRGKIVIHLVYEQSGSASLRFVLCCGATRVQLIFALMLFLN